MSAAQTTENLYKIPILGIECNPQTFNFYANTAVNNQSNFKIDSFIWLFYNTVFDKKIKQKRKRRR